VFGGSGGACGAATGGGALAADEFTWPALGNQPMMLAIPAMQSRITVPAATMTRGWVLLPGATSPVMMISRSLFGQTAFIIRENLNA
jgi:hypothetical protein